ncbi:flavin reductase family protein [Samsonia erythrinae]|uniref:Flavin reductase (DIM6/NTAB) family NADH-FMN oxidoreductase RutF n=1 Tax=Samsonia erythrinae TaxID=160434 RepID=A0A4R3VU98_9GAMM|nr:flavin reductase family protein [Samsonia erythrinae]TCV08986.1 flavin reductase (DIM6/NTAB) family NADH-FMN oxidoreductase RutF [Samsonia erythrinae]
MQTDKRRQLRDAFGAFMTGVTVVTSRDKTQQPIGFTANSFTSVSLDPALLLVSIDKRSANFANFTECSHFAVNILAEQQKETSNIFASKVEDRFGLVDWHASEKGTPIIDGASAWFDCTLHQVVDAGDHAILIGRVEDFESQATAGLGYYRGAYFTPYHNAETLIHRLSVEVSALIECNGHAIMVQKDGAASLPTRSVEKGSVSDTLEALIAELGVNANPGFVYSVYEDRQNNKQHIVFLCPLPTDTALTPLHQGEWFDLDRLSSLSMRDSALKSLMNRFVRENSVGNYSIYYGDEINGSIKQFAS